MSNTRQILQAIEIYSIDHGDRLPFGRDVRYGYWMEEIGLISGGKATLIDPQFTFRRELEPLHDSLAGYALNECLNAGFTRLSIVNPSRTILVAPASFFLISDETSRDWRSVIFLATPDTLLEEQLKRTNPGKTVEVQGPYGATRYFGAGVYGFVDGHVKSLKPNQIERMPDDDACGYAGALKTPNSNTGPTFVAWHG